VTFNFSKFIQNILVPLSFSAAEVGFMKGLRSAAGKYSDFAKIIETNPEIEKHFLGKLNETLQSRLKEPLTSAAVALSMVGFVPARNFMAASLLKGDLNKLSPGDPNIIKAIPFALEGEAKGGQLATELFIGGLVYDILGSALQGDAEKALLLTLWKHGLQISHISCKLSQTLVPQMTLERSLCLDAVLHDLGKLGYLGLDPIANPPSPSKTAPSKEQKKIDHSILADHTWLKELNTYGIPHDALGYFILSRFGFIQDTVWIALYHHQPFLAHRLGPSAHARTMLLWLADHLIRFKEFHQSSKIPDRLIQNWFKVLQPHLGTCPFQKFESAVKTALA
jgi:hypothetical protein